MPTIELPAGRIAYEDTGGPGPVIVLLHGVLMDHRQWAQVVSRLRPDYRCVAPTLPLGAHSRAMHATADLSLRGQARIVADFLDALDLADVILCFNDWAAPQLLVADGLTDRVAGMLLAACETAGNYPPGLAGRNLALLGALPGGLAAALRALRFRPLRRTPMTFGWMAKHGIPDDLVDAWLAPASADRGVRRDLEKYVRGTKDGRRDLIAATRELDRFTRPVRVVWAEDDRLMPLAEGRRLASGFPTAQFHLVKDSYTLLPLDQPAALARHIRELAADAVKEAPRPSPGDHRR